MAEHLPERARRTDQLSQANPFLPDIARPLEAPRHAGRALTFDTTPDCDDCWRGLGVQLRDRLLALAGEVVLWWCRQSAEETHADVVVLGKRALVMTESRAIVGADGRLRDVYVLPEYVLDPASFLRVDVTGFANPLDRAPQRPHPGIMAPPPDVSDLGLDDDVKGMIGNLPARAQQLLQEPFIRDDRIEQSRYYYWGEAHELDMFSIVLAGRRSVTFATGSMRVPLGYRSDAAHWTLVCGRARVTSRRLPRDAQ
jgi:hypothetical protein